MPNATPEEQVQLPEGVSGSHDGARAEHASHATAKPVGGKRRPWRRQYFILKKLQFRIIAHQLGATLAFVVIVALSIFGPSVSVLLSDSVSDAVRLEHADRLLLLHQVFWPTIAIGLLFLFITSVLVSHRIAGPLYRFRKVMDAVGHGRIETDVKIRPRDFLIDEVKHMNTMLKQLSSRVECMQVLHRDLIETIEFIAKDPDSSDALGEDLLTVLLHQARMLADELGKFHLVGEATTASTHEGSKS